MKGYIEIDLDTGKEDNEAVRKSFSKFLDLSAKGIRKLMKVNKLKVKVDTHIK